MTKVCWFTKVCRHTEYTVPTISVLGISHCFIRKFEWEKNKVVMEEEVWLITPLFVSINSYSNKSYPQCLSPNTPTNKQNQRTCSIWIPPVFGTYSAQAFSFWSDCTIAVTGIQWSGNGQEIHLTVVMGPHQVVPVLQGEETKINASQKDSF